MPNEPKIFTAHDVVALQEEINKGIKVIGEQHGTIQKDIKDIKQTLEEHSEILKDMGLDIIETKEELGGVKEELGGVKKEIAEFREENKQEHEFLRMKLENVVYRSDFEELEKRVKFIEQKLGLSISV